MEDIDESSVRLRSRPDNVKLFDGLLTHASKIALIQYTISGMFIYLYVTDAFHDLSTPVDLLGLKFKLSLWVTVAPLVYAFINFHMCRVMKQMTRLLQRDRQNAALMAIMAVQSVWFGNPFHNAASKSILSMCAVFYSVICLAIPFFAWPYLAGTVLVTEITRQVPMDNIAYLTWGVGVCNFALAASVFALWDVGFDQCRIQIRKALFRPSFGPPRQRAAVTTASQANDAARQTRPIMHYMKHLFRNRHRLSLITFVLRRRRGKLS